MLATLGLHCGAQQIEPENIPDEIVPAMGSVPFSAKYELNEVMNPFYLRGDFDGDGKPDFAVGVKSKTGGATGIAIWLSSLRRFVILGAGNPFRFAGSTETNFAGLNVWRVYGKRTVETGVEAGRPPKLIGEAILLGKSESGSGLIYWNGKTFKWYQQGD